VISSPLLVREPRLDYVALGIHKPQDLTRQPAPGYLPGPLSVDLGERGQILHPRHRKGQSTQAEWRKLETLRPFLDRYIKLETQENVTDHILSALPTQKNSKTLYFD
jgi:hypothetical protein